MLTATAPGQRHGFDAIGTRWTITTDEAIAPATLDRVEAVVEQYDATWSRFRPDSAVARLEKTGGPEDLGEPSRSLLPLLATLRDLTGGAMTPLVAASLEYLGYGAGRAQRGGDGYRPAPAAEVRQEGVIVHVDPPAMLDVGAAGKGQLVDLVSAELTAGGHERHVVDASGDLMAVGEPLRVALEHPFDPSAAIGVVRVADAAIAGSAVNRRTWTGPDGRRLHHVLDARTGRPVETIAATWAVARTAMVADALATALFLLPPEALSPHFDFAWVVMRTDGTASRSAGLPGELFS